MHGAPPAGLGSQSPVSLSQQLLDPRLGVVEPIAPPEYLAVDNIVGRAAPLAVRSGHVQTHPKLRRQRSPRSLAAHSHAQGFGIREVTLPLADAGVGLVLALVNDGGENQLFVDADTACEGAQVLNVVHVTFFKPERVLHCPAERDGLRSGPQRLLHPDNGLRSDQNRAVRVIFWLGDERDAELVGGTAEVWRQRRGGQNRPRAW